MVEVRFLENDAVLMVSNANELFLFYRGMSDRFTFVVNGEELQKSGQTATGYFNGYSESYFEKYFK